MLKPVSGPVLPALALLAVTALAGCEGGLAGSLRSAGVGGSPDEFLVLPTRPLVIPSELESLPPPTPGSDNLVDYKPNEEAITGLTGRSTVPQGANGQALVAAAGPVDPHVRARLNGEDAVYREANRGLLLERWFAQNQEALIYETMILDAGDEYERFQSMGVRQPSAPPQLLEDD